MGSVDEVRERSDIVEVVSGHVQLRKSGRNFTGRCPFHEERTPSFVVTPDRGTWRCFGACGVGGDVFDFVMRIENVDFRGALEILARRYGVELETPNAEASRREEARKRYRDALDAAATFYHQQLLSAASGAPARAYLERRRFGGQAVSDFQLGWAPDAWSVAGDALRARGFTNDELVAAGLARPRDGGGVFDTFRGRLMFPIRDVRGRVVGFGARTLDPDGVPKYLNSPQSDLFDKSRMLYGIDRAVRAIRDGGTAVVVEGYTDVIRAHAAGFTNVVASLGTALTEHHVAMLKRYAARIVLALDADAAGQAATLRGLEVVREAAGGEPMPVLTPRGAVRYQQHMDVDLRIAVLPAGKDPDDVVRDDPDTWRRLVDEAPPVMSYLFDVLTAGLDLDDPAGKTEAADRLMPVIADVPDPVARAAWVARLADLIRVDHQTLTGRLAQPQRPRGSRQRASTPAPEPPAARRTARETGHDPATWLLGHLLVDPGRVRLLAARLRDEGLAPLSGDDMPGRAERDLLEAVRNAARGTPPPDTPPEHRLDALPADLAAMAEALRTTAAAEPPLTESAVVAALRWALLRVRERECKQRIEQLKHLIGDSEGEDREPLGARLASASAEFARVQKLLRPDVGRAMGKVDAVVRRRK